MYPQIKIIAEDPNAQRFLWISLRRDCKPDTFQMESLVFGKKYFFACAQFVKNKNARDILQLFPQVASAIIDREIIITIVPTDKVEEGIASINQDVVIHMKWDLQFVTGYQIKSKR